MTNHNRNDARSGRDGNLSSIVSQIRDDGPVDLLDPETRAVSPIEDEPRTEAGREAGRVERGRPFLVREAVPSVGRSRHAGAPSAQESSPKQSHTPSPPTRGRGLRIALAFLTAAMMSLGVVLLLYRPTLEDLWPRPASVADGALDEEIAGLKASIAVLAERLEAIDEPFSQPGVTALDAAPSSLSEGAQSPSDGRVAVELDNPAAAQLTERIAVLTAQLEELVANARLAGEDLGPESTPQVPESTGAPGQEGAPRTDAADVATKEPASADSNSGGAESEGSVPRAVPEPIATPARSLVDALGRSAPDGPNTDSAIVRGDGVQTEATWPRSEPGRAQVRASAGKDAEMRGVTPADSAQRSRVPGVVSGRIVPVQPPSVADVRSESLVPRPPSNARQRDRLGEGPQQFAGAAQEEAPMFKGSTAQESSDSHSRGGSQASSSVARREAGAAVSGQDPHGRWFVNIIAVRGEPAANELRKSYLDQGVKTKVVAIGGGNLFGVRVTGLATRTDAVAQAEAIEERLGIGEVWIGQD